MLPEYRDLYFGKSDSRNEYAENREEFVRSYVDLKDTSKSVLHGNKFLVLGPKGTGKSALGWYLQATAGPSSHIALHCDASTLPLAEVPRLQTGQVAGPERSVSAWTFILLCNYLELLLSDGSCSIHQEREALRVAQLLREYGFIGDLTGRAIVKASNATVRIPVPQRGIIYRREGRPDLSIYNLIPYLESWATSVASPAKHVLLVDGLDSIFLNDSLYDESLSSLVQAAYLLNQKLTARRATGNIVLLLRNDVFARIALSLPDSQKMRDDLSLNLDWRVLSGAAGVNAPLMQLVDAKASRALGVDHIEVLRYFPEKIKIGGRASGPPRLKPTLSYFLNLTRHTPRDLLRLFEEIRQVEESGVFPSNGTKVSEQALREGVLQYSTKYFVGAIRNEFAGVEGGPQLAAMAVSALQHIGKQRFDRDDFAVALAGLGENDPVKVDKLLTMLFFAGAIGNLVARAKEPYMQFYHRRDESEIYLKGQFILHGALLHAWGMPYSI